MLNIKVEFSACGLTPIELKMMSAVEYKHSHLTHIKKKLFAMFIANSLKLQTTKIYFFIVDFHLSDYVSDHLERLHLNASKIIFLIVLKALKIQLEKNTYEYFNIIKDSII